MLALAVGTGLETLHVLLEERVTALAGTKGKHKRERTAVRHGSALEAQLRGGAGGEPLVGSKSRVRERARRRSASRSISSSRPKLYRTLGGAWVLDQLWRRLRIDATLRRLLDGRRLDPRAEQALFALVANRALKPLSKLAATAWVGQDVAMPGLDEVDEDTCYRSMEWLLEVETELAEAVYWATADVLDLEVDLLFFDITVRVQELVE